ncbi:PUA-like domain-containing protein [Trichoderma barbatum]
MPRRLRWLIPAVRFATDSRPSYKILDSDSDLDEKRLEQPDSYEVLLSIGLLESKNKRLNEPKLLELSDDIRSHLVEDASLGPRAEVVKRALRELVRDESSAIPVMEFAIIQNARLDKLLSDMLTVGHQQASFHLRPRIDIVTAERLQRLWMARFREKYFNIDQTRHLGLSKTGALKDIWLNLACAHRDGIVGSIIETPTKGKYGDGALPLLTGREEVLPSGTVRYMREAKLSETHVSLISSVGTQIRILRGHRLRSPLSPKAGIRYDGLYIIRQYSHKQNMQTRLHRTVITLERISGQPNMTDLAKVPRPSQMDDWVLFEKFEGEMIRQHHGEQSFLEWKLMKAQERMEQRQWRRALEVGAALTTARHARYSYGMRDLGLKKNIEEPSNH